MSVEIRNDEGHVVWTAIGTYGWPETSNKHLSWALMREIRESTVGPIIFFGDFNEILQASEKEGGAIRRYCLINAFRDAVDLCGVHDLGYRGESLLGRGGLTRTR